jgi:hypothetical protein
MPDYSLLLREQLSAGRAAITFVIFAALWRTVAVSCAAAEHCRTRWGPAGKLTKFRNALVINHTITIGHKGTLAVNHKEGSWNYYSP